MSFKVKPNVDGTTSFLNGSDVEVLKVPAIQASADKQVATYGDVIGVGQTWQDVTASRVSGTTYTNSTGKPILVSFVMRSVASVLYFIIDGINVSAMGEGTAYTGDTYTQHALIVPNGSTYGITSGSSFSIWAELR